MCLTCHESILKMERQSSLSSSLFLPRDPPVRFPADPASPLSDDNNNLRRGWAIPVPHVSRGDAPDSNERVRYQASAELADDLRGLGLKFSHRLWGLVISRRARVTTVASN